MAIGMKGIAILVGIFLLSSYVVAPYLGLSGMIPVLAVTALIAVLLTKTKGFNPLGKSFKSNTFLMGLLIPLFVIGLYAGYFESFGLNAASFGLVPGSTSTPMPFIETPTEVKDACKASVNPYIIGKAATVTITAYDKESTTPYSGGVNAALFIARNGDILSTIDGSMSNYAVGDVINIYGQDNSTGYYVDDKLGVCINSEAFPVSLDAHAVAATASVTVSCFDDTGASACSSGTNATEEDFDITLSASEETTFFLKVKEATAVKSFNLFGVATRVTNDIATCEPTGSEWIERTVPDFMNKNLAASANPTGTNVTNGYGNFWTLGTPENPNNVLLTEYQWRKYEFKIKAGTTDPSNTDLFSSSDMCIACFFDATRTRGEDGKLYYDAFTHTSSEANVGFVENYTHPEGGTGACVVIEGI